jgi:hypothetical protein
MEVIDQLHALSALPPYPLDRRLGRSQRRYGRSSEEEGSQPLSEIEPPSSSPSLVTVLTELPRLLTLLTYYDIVLTVHLSLLTFTYFLYGFGAKCLR